MGDDMIDYEKPMLLGSKLGSFVNSSSQTEPPPTDDEYTPAECYDTCVHARACKMQYERHICTYPIKDEAMVQILGCGEDCAEYEDAR
jgi:hypothetical protein